MLDIRIRREEIRWRIVHSEGMKDMEDRGEGGKVIWKRRS